MSPAAARHSTKLGKFTLVTVPGFGTFQLTYEAETALAVVTAVWLDNTALAHLPVAQFAPPVLERWVQGRRTERQVVDFGLDWS